MATFNTKKSIRMRRALYFSLLSLLFVLAVPLIPYAINAQAQDAAVNNTDQPAKLNDPGIKLWNEVRQRDGVSFGSSQVTGVDRGVLINASGEDWRRFRMEMLMPYGAIAMGAVITAIALFYLFHGKTVLPSGRTGKRILRFTLNQRTAHWFTVSIFWLLGITGLILLYGRFVLIPLLGAEGFSITASACKEMHNLIGPLFLLGVLAMLVLFVKDNIFTLVDLKWLAKVGGMFGGHASAGRFNAGEKSWFWLVMIFGSALCVTGLILDFSVFGQGREMMALAHVIHGISALLLISISFGHIYLGTIGVEGTLESMTTGYVDTAWAQAHHDQWYEQVIAAGDSSTAEKAGKGSAARPTTDPAASK
jgi:formate dehydrogenase subunit gamma